MMADQVRDPSNMSPEEARATFGDKFELFCRVLGAEAKAADLPAFACIVITERGIQVVSGGTHEEWRPTMRRIAQRVATEIGQHLISAGLGRKPGHG